MVNTQNLVNRALEGLDYVGFQLEEMGVTDKVNRHNIMAYLFAEQKNLEGQLESLTARVGAQKVKIERLRDEAERRLNQTVELALTPWKMTVNTINQVRTRLS